jgi:hypothetical protein
MICHVPHDLSRKHHILPAPIEPRYLDVSVQLVSVSNTMFHPSLLFNNTGQINLEDGIVTPH